MVLVEVALGEKIVHKTHQHVVKVIVLYFVVSRDFQIGDKLLEVPFDLFLE